jgi:glycogen operon protein
MMIGGRARVTGLRRRGEDETLLIIFNAWHDLINFTLPDTAGADGWERLIDTNAADESEERFDVGSTYQVTGRSVLLFRLVQSDQSG